MSSSVQFAYSWTSRESQWCPRRVSYESYLRNVADIIPPAAFVPGRAGPFVTQLSEKLALFAPQLTLDFLTEVAAGMDKAPACQRIACLQYMSPWIRNLGCFTNPTHHLYEPSGAKFRDCVRVLIDLTLADQEVTYLLHS